MFGSLNTRDPIFTPDPVNRHHSSNLGLQAWWLGLKDLAGDATWYELLGAKNGANTAITWGAGEDTLVPLVFSGSSKVTVASAAYAPINTPALTWIVSFRIDSLANAYTSIMSDESATTGSTILIKSSGKLAIYLSFSTGVDNHFDGTGPTTLSTGIWYDVAVTWDGSTVLVGYTNGVVEATVSFGRGGMPAGGAALLFGDSPISSRKLTGQIRSVRIFNRNLSAAEIAEDYRLSQTGYPGALNRLDLDWLPAPPSAQPAAMLAMM